MKVVISTLVAAPIERVFALITDIEHWPQIIKAIERIEILGPMPVQLGTRFRETRQMFGRPASEEMTVAEIQPPVRFVLTAKAHGTSYRAEHFLTSQSSGGTNVKLAFFGHPESLAARFLKHFGLLFSSRVKAQLEADLADLKTAAEREPATSSRT